MKDKTISIIRLLRVKHYIKNLLLFIPVFFNKGIFNYYSFGTCFLGFISFSLMASVVYIFNDIKDVEKDRNHAKKKNRPIASGEVKRSEAIVIAVVLLIGSIFIAYVAKDFIAVVIVCFYLIINIAYSCGLKDVPILDVAILTLGFVIRVVLGAYITNVTISGWLYLTIFSGAFYMGLGKRRNEIKMNVSNDKNTRESLKHYSYEFLDKNMYVCLALTDTFYALWAKEQVNRYIIWTVPVFVIIVMKYSLTVEGKSDGDPVEVIIRDKFLIVLLLIYAFLMVLFIYGINL